MSQLVRITHDINGCNTAIDDFESCRLEKTPFVVPKDARRGIDHRKTNLFVGTSELAYADKESGHLGSASNWFRCGRNFAAAVRVQHGILAQQRQQTARIPFSTRLDELLQQAFLQLRRSLKTRFPLGQMLFGAADHLAAIRFVLVDDSADLAVIVLEHFAQQEDRTLGWSQCFQQDEKCGAQRIG